MSAVISFMVFLACVLPFVWADWPSFKKSTVDNLIAIGLREDAYTIVAYLHHTLHWSMPKLLATALALAGALLGVASIWRSPPHQAFCAMTYACWMAYGFAFNTHSG
jgi:hypothetical protein